MWKSRVGRKEHIGRSDFFRLSRVGQALLAPEPP
jgi:hypothetical protein